MFNILKLTVINVVLCLSLVEANSSAISSNDNSEDISSANRPDSVQYLYDKSVNVVYTNPSHASNKVFIQSSAKRRNTTADNVTNLAWDTEEKVLEASWFRQPKENEESKCLLDSLKLAIMWWCHSNGTLRDTNFHVLNHKQQLDLSHRNISSDQRALQMVSKYLPGKRNITMVAFSLAYNNLTRVPFNTLQMVANSLKYLSLKGNSFIVMEMNAAGENTSHCILNENDLKFFVKGDSTKLRFVNTRRQLAWATFPNLPALTELDISNCHIKYIGKEAFKNLPQLKSLYLSHNKILNIPADTFLYTPSLQVLDLSFANVYDSLFSHVVHAPNLESVLKLLYGVNIEPQFFKYLPNLVYLDLSHTKLRSSSAVAFSYTCPTLQYLSLCYTSFPAFGKGMFKSSSLIGLDLSGNPNAAFGLDEEVFVGLAHSLNYLFFEKSSLRDLSWLKPLKNLHFLALAGNNINTLLARDFMPLKQLQILDLSSNHVSNWYSQVFHHNEKLRILGLRDNNINFISSAMLSDLSMLIYLSLGSNNFICDCILRDLVDVSSINNQLAQCKGNFSQTIKSNIEINSIYLPEILLNSKLFANTSLSGLDVPSLVVSQNLYKFNQTTKKVQLKANPGIRFILQTLKSKTSPKTCLYEHNSTSSYLGRKLNSSILKLQLLDYREEQYWCYNQSRKETLRGLNCQRSYLIDNIEQELSALTTYILSSVGSLILLVSLGILVYLKRWHIYYYYSSLKSAALLSVVSKDKHDSFKNLCDQNSNIIYDVFISYCQSDRDWIVEELMPNIEKTGDISICLHERDFQVGITILDNIVSCMERSKAMMLIISSNFLLSHWCQFEMQLAHHHILDLHKDNLILVFLEDIPRSKRPKNLQFLMNVKTYIKWPGGNVHPEERKLFWKRLKRSLKNTGWTCSESKA